MNDFDETLPGPFEWDVKRLAASLVIAGRSRGFAAPEQAKIATAAMRSYRTQIRTFAGMTNLDIWYARLDVEQILASRGAEVGAAVLKRFRRAVDKAGSKDRLKAKAKLTELVDGELRFVSDPPLLVPVRELYEPGMHQQASDTIEHALHGYRDTLISDRRDLFDRYRFVDLARKVVGVGSVGTRAWVALMVGRDDDDPFFLQVKEAAASVFEPYLAPSAFENHGERVVKGQRLVQAASDIFLGWQRVEEAESADGRSHDYYVRQLWDWKASADLEIMEPTVMEIYGQLCGWALARAHARSGDAIAVGAYLGSGDSFDKALTRFAVAYADQNERDHRALVDQIASGAVTAQTGI